MSSCAIQVEKGIEHFTHICRSWAASWFGWWDQGFYDRPLFIAEVDFDSLVGAWETSSLHHP
jgi:hypothetical protein